MSNPELTQDPPLAEAARGNSRLRRAAVFALAGLATLSAVLWAKFGSTVFVDMLGVVTSCF